MPLSKKEAPSVWRRFNNGILFFFSCLAMNGCVQENDIPAYLYVPSFSLSVVSGQGTALNKITDVWVYIDGISQGIYQLPAVFPVVDVGSHQVQLFPGVRNNGIKSNPVIYPFLNSYTITKDLKPGKTDTLRPSTTYNSLTNFKIIEDFESGNSLTIDRDAQTALRFGRVDGGIEGKCAGLTLTKSNPLIEKASATKVQIPDATQYVYLEMNYKTQAPLSVGIVGSNLSNPTGTSSYKVTLYPTDVWNKVYINLTNEIKDLRMIDYQLVFQSQLPDSLATANVYIDNIKLLQR